MSYSLAPVLQKALFAHLSAHQPLSDLIGTALFDAKPMGDVPDLYVAFGDETALDQSDSSGGGAVHEVNFEVITKRAGFLQAKTVASVLCERLVDAKLSLERGKLVSLGFIRAKAVRTGRNDTRKITLTFRARVCGT